MNFKTGDVVQLKSGGTIMTIEEIEDDSAHCVWSDNGKIERDNFYLATLKIVE